VAFAASGEIRGDSIGYVVSMVYTLLFMALRELNISNAAIPLMGRYVTYPDFEQTF
jgi:hypothetical protein